MAKDTSIKLSAIVIAKNEEEDIRDCLNSLAFASEVIVIDSESTDKTVEIAKEKGARVIKHSFTNFSDLRNVGLNSANGAWILYIDADERVSKELGEEIMDAVEKEEYDIYKIPRKNIYFRKYNWPEIEYMERLFRKTELTGWQGEIHESPKVTSNKISVLKNSLMHFTHTDLESMVDKTLVWGDIEAQLLFDAKHPEMKEWRFIRIMITKFANSYFKQGGWKIGVPGLIESIYQAYSYFIIYAKLWELQTRKKDFKN
jgi:glycosyltransferase involved in cell wall biosynthesis